MHAANVDKIITEDLDFEKLHISTKTKIAKIYKIKINNSTAALQDVALKKPSKHHIKKHHLITKRDTFAIKILNDKDKEVYMIGIGNPFFIRAQHIGYENEPVSGGYRDNAIFDFAVPSHITPKTIIVSKRDSYEDFQEIHRIDLKD